MRLPKLSTTDYRIGLEKLDIDKVTTDLESIYDKVMSDLNAKEQLKPTDLSFMNFILNVKRDKEEIIKFMLNYELKKKELELRSNHSEAITEVVLND